MPAFDPRDIRSLDDAFWSAVGGALPVERRALLSRLLSSPEFETLRHTWRSSGSSVTPAPGDTGPGSDEGFVRVAYECFLGRPADEGGLRHYTAALVAGETRAGVIRSLVLSDEFARRADAIPRDRQLCELANPAKWDNGEWLDILRSLGLADDKLSMHRKPYEFAQLIYGCRHLGVLNDAATIVSVGAGHERILYWLANHAGHVVATDMYEGVWKDIQGQEGDPAVLQRPDTFAPFPYRRERLTFLKMDGRRLGIRDDAFDIAYSLSSIEHFGGLAGAIAAIREMARIVRPGGIAVVATEYVLEGPPHDETFQPADIDALVRESGLDLVEPIDTRVYHRHSFEAVDLHATPYRTPHMVVRFRDTVFTTVMMFLRKQAQVRPETRAR
jgi:SAM-dependent methyltransferase